jgi:predicted metal-binding membrane protein
MDAGPGTDPGSLGFYLSTWIVMTAAMMLPSTAPAVLAYRSRGARMGGGMDTVAFLGGYLLAWVGAGFVAYALLEAGRSYAGTAFAWDRAGRWTAVAILGLAATYEITPLKRACLSRCRGEDAVSSRGPVRAGLEHGTWCLGCCWALMAALFALGAMSLLWMALIAVVIGAQKLPSRGARTILAAPLVLAALSVGVATFPGGVPGLTIPGGSGAMHSMQSTSSMAR